MSLLMLSLSLSIYIYIYFQFHVIHTNSLLLLKSESDLALIVQGYLGSIVDAQGLRELSTHVVAFYRSVMDDNSDIRDGSNCKPHFSLRTLCRSLIHVRSSCRMYGLNRALFDGFCMNFQTLLDQRSGALMKRKIVENLFGSKGTGPVPSLPSLNALDRECYVSVLEFWLQRGSLPLMEPTDYILTDSVKENLRNILRAVVSANFPVLLQGPTSSGKTSMVEYLVSYKQIESSN